MMRSCSHRPHRHAHRRRRLCRFVSGYFKQPVTPADVVRTFSGVRPLYDDGASSATAATRDYVLSLDDKGPACLHVFGGKITTYRRLAEAALAKLSSHLPGATGAWTAGAPLPGGDFPVDGAGALADALRRDHPFLTAGWANRLVRAYGTEAFVMLDGARTAADLGRHFGATLTESELRWMIRREWARDAQGVLWRRSKLGLRMTPEQAAAVEDYVASRRIAA